VTDFTNALKPVRRALLSVTDKTGLVDFARALASHHIELVSTGGTSKALRDAGLTVRDISDLTGFPEMLDGRVKTLHPKVHGGILHIRDNPEHVAAVHAHAIEPIDMVVVNLYAFEKTASKPGVAFHEIIENIDIGGPSMVRSAAKNFADVAIVTSVADYPLLAEELAANAGSLTHATRWRLAKQAFATTAAYDAGIATALESIAEPSGPAVFDPSLPQTIRVIDPVVATLRYGENPHQKAALYSDGSGKGIASALQLQGKELSYNNIVDLDACWELVREFDSASDAAVVIIKHTNPCGASTGATVLEAYRRALEADPVSAFGGVLGINREVDGEAAEEIAKLFVEAIVAPAYTPEALARFSAKKNLRLLQITPADNPRVLKQVSGGLLVQDSDRLRISEADLKIVTDRQPTPEELRPLLRWPRPDRRHRSRPDEPRRCSPFRSHEGRPAARRQRNRLRRLLPLPRRPRSRGRSRRHRRHPARRLGPRRRGHRRRQQTRHRHGFHRGTTLPPRLNTPTDREKPDQSPSHRLVRL
jgi:phosphoribosylaminoimidazolecarboxamide formyltransferase/IMP cyclohydrolase